MSSGCHLKYWTLLVSNRGIELDGHCVKKCTICRGLTSQTMSIWVQDLSASCCIPRGWSQLGYIYILVAPSSASSNQKVFVNNVCLLPRKYFARSKGPILRVHSCEFTHFVSDNYFRNPDYNGSHYNHRPQRHNNAVLAVRMC